MSTDIELDGADGPLRRFYRGRKVLIAGADGFLGVNCIEALQRLGAAVSIVSRRKMPHAEGFDGPVFRGDLRDAALVQAAIADQEVIFDFAGATGAADSNAAPLANVDIEVTPHLTLFQACAAQPTPPLVVFCSSRLVYGRPQYLPVDEAHPLSPTSLYAAHKITTENYLRVFHQTHGLPYCIVRLSNPYGPHDDPQAKSYGAVNRFIQLASRHEPIRIYGDGSQLRDYIYVADALRVFLSLAAHARCHNTVFNLGAPQPLHLREAVEIIAKLAGGTRIDFVPWPANARVVETGDYHCDHTKLNAHVSLPAPLSFAEGVRRTLQALQARAADAPPVAAESSRNRRVG